jgi:hypothetical protein
MSLEIYTQSPIQIDLFEKFNFRFNISYDKMMNQIIKVKISDKKLSEFYSSDNVSVIFTRLGQSNFVESYINRVVN